MVCIPGTGTCVLLGTVLVGGFSALAAGSDVYTLYFHMNTEKKKNQKMCENDAAIGIYKQGCPHKYKIIAKKRLMQIILLFAICVIAFYIFLRLLIG